MLGKIVFRNADKDLATDLYAALRLRYPDQGHRTDAGRGFASDSMRWRQQCRGGVHRWHGLGAEPRRDGRNPRRGHRGDGFERRSVSKKEPGLVRAGRFEGSCGAVAR